VPQIAHKDNSAMSSCDDDPLKNIADSLLSIEKHNKKTLMRSYDACKFPSYVLQTKEETEIKNQILYDSKSAVRCVIRWNSLN
jgi:hypothetical protein